MRVNENKIREINEVTGVKLGAYDDYAGYRLVTYGGRIVMMLISDRQHCCESYGYMSTPDDVSKFVDADLISVSSVAIGDYDSNQDSSQTAFINVETSIGQLQFSVYNAHNGYYGHKVYVIDTEITATI